MNQKQQQEVPDLRGHVVQIDPNAPGVAPRLRGCLGHIVSVHSWGSIIGVRVPAGGELVEHTGGVAYVRCLEDYYRPVGAAPWVPPWSMEG